MKHYGPGYSFDSPEAEDDYYEHILDAIKDGDRSPIPPHHILRRHGSRCPCSQCEPDPADEGLRTGP